MVRTALIVMGVLLAGRALSAQSIGAPPPGSVFGAATGSDRQRLDVLVDLSGGLDSEIPLEFRRRIPQDALQSGGYSSMLVTSVDYVRNRRLVQVDGTAVSSLRYYQQLDQISAAGTSGGLGLTVHLPKGATAEMHQTAAYSPSYLNELFSGGAPVDTIQPAPDYRVDEATSFLYTTRATVGVGSTRGQRMSATVQRSRTDFTEQSLARPDLEVTEASAEWSFGTGRSGSLSADYTYREGTFGVDGTSIEHQLRIGVEYSHALSSTRRAVFSLAMAPSTLRTPESTTAAAAISGTLYKLQVDASIGYRFRRSWSFDASYGRGIEYVAVLRQPVFRDAARLQLTGLLSRHVDLAASAGYVAGESALSRNSQTFDTYTGDLRIRFALSRALALYGQYLHYYYDLRGYAALAPDLPGEFEQRSLRAGLMLWGRPVGR